jgi:outer membrane protein assembly factor BamA
MRGLWKLLDFGVPLVILCLLLLAKPDETKLGGDRVRKVDALGASPAPDVGRQGRDRARSEEVVLYGGVQFKPGRLASKTIQEPARLRTAESPFVGRLSPGAGSPDLIVPVGGEDAEPEEPARLENTDADDLIKPEFNEPLSAILIEGNKAVPTEEILKLVGTRVGQIPDRKQIKADVRALIVTRLFCSVVPRIVESEAGPVLVFNVVERDSPENVLSATSDSSNDTPRVEQADSDPGLEPDSPVLDIKADFKNLTEPLADVVIEGNRAVSSATLLELMETRRGHIPNRFTIKQDVYELYAKCWFSSVVVRVEPTKAGPVLVVKVVEKPVLEKVTFIGNKLLTDEELLTLTGLAPGPGFDVNRNRRAIHGIESRYREYGYMHAKVELDKGGSPDDREVVIKIEEGPQAVVTKVSFDGNESVPAAVLRSQVRAASPMLRFQPAIFYPSGIAEGQRALRDCYHRLGFFDVKVTCREGTTEDLSKVHLHYVIDEGPRYAVRSIEFTGNDVLSEAELRAGMKQHENAYYDQRLVDADRNKILAQYGELRRFFASANAHPRAFEEPGFVDIIYQVYEGRVCPDLSDAAPGSSAGPGKNGAILQTAATMPAEVSEPPGLRDVNRLVFQGLSTFPASEIRDELSKDFDVLGAERPEISMRDYLRTLEKQVRSGYRHHGFGDAKVEAVHDPSKQQIVVKVDEGRRFRCRDVQIVGAKFVPAAKIIAALTEDPKPSRILWKKGDPVRFDELAESAIRKRIEEAFGEAGFLSPQFSVITSPTSDGESCDLTVTVASEGPRAMLGKIDVTGTKRDSVEDVVKYLDLEPGMPYDSDLEYRLHRKLWDSGRYLTIDVTPTAHDSPDPAIADRTRDLYIRLREYDDAPPLTKELAPEEQALLKLRDWIERWSRGEIDEEIVVTASTRDELPAASEPLDSHFPPMKFRMVLAPNRGQTISVSALRPDGKSILDVLFGVYPDRLVFAAPQRRMRLQLPNSAEDRVIFNVQGKAASAKSIERGDRRFLMSFGFGVSSSSKPSPTAFEVKARFSPAFAISLAHTDKRQCTLREGVWKIHSESLELQFDAATGRPIELRYPAMDVSIRTETDALDGDRITFEAALAKCTTAYDSPSPWQSRVEFFLECWYHIARYAQLQAVDQRIAAAVTHCDPASPWQAFNEVCSEIQQCLSGEERSAEGVESQRVLRKLVHRWSPPAIADLIEPWWGRTSPEPRDPFCIPSHRAGWNYDDLLKPGSQSRKNFIARLVLPLYHNLVPRTGWMWPAGRDAALYWAAQDRNPASRLQQNISSPDTGPLGELFLGSLDTLFLGTFDTPIEKGQRNLNTQLTQEAGRAGLQRLATAAIERDYRALLKGDSWLGQWCLSLAGALRELNESELRALARLLPDDMPREAIVQCLLRLRTGRDKPIEQVLPLAFDALWSEVLIEPVRAAFLRMANLAEIRPDEPHRDDQVHQAGAEEDADAEPVGEPRPVPLSEPLPEALEEIPELTP